MKTPIWIMTIGIIWLSCQSKIDNQQASKNKTLAINDTITKPIDSIIKSNFIAEDKPQVQPPSVIPTPIIPMEIAELVIVDSPNLIPIKKKTATASIPKSKWMKNRSSFTVPGIL